LQTFKLKQISVMTGLMLLGVLLFLIFVLPFIIFGLDPVTDFVYRVGAKGVIILVAILIWPLLKIKKYFSNNLEITVDQFNFTIKKEGVVLKSTALKNIVKMQYNHLTNRALGIYLNDGIKFFQLHNRIDVAEDREVTKNIINAIKAQIDFKDAVSEQGQSIFKRQVTTYTRDH
jgi:hypothetical protein